jgi:hypothetical protein
VYEPPKPEPIAVSVEPTPAYIVLSPPTCISGEATGHLVEQPYPSSFQLPAAKLTIADIIHAVCVESGVRRLDLISQRRTKNLVLPRHIAMALCRELTGLSYPTIGRRFGGRDHTTVMHAADKFRPQCAAVRTRLLPDAPVIHWAREMLRECGYERKAD